MSSARTAAGRSGDDRCSTSFSPTRTSAASGRSTACGTPPEVALGVVIRMVDAGHILGSASVEMTIEENGRKRAVVFSGDLRPRAAECPTLGEVIRF